MHLFTGTVCDKCGAESTNHCDCFGEYCQSCYDQHDCKHKPQPKQWIKATPAPVRTTLGLRPYQAEAKAAVFSAFNQVSKALVVMPTGTGKTVLFAHVANEWPAGRVIVMAHRDELIRQAADKIEKVIGEPCDIEMGEQFTDTSGFHRRSKVLVTSVQTMSRERRQARFKPPEYGLLVIDEAHRATAATYQKVIQYFGQNRNLKVLGVTATPDRTDEEALGKVFDAVAYEYQIDDAIRDGYLVPIKQRFVYVEGLDFSQIKTKGGDLDQKALSRVLEQEEMIHRIVGPTIEIAAGRKTLMFTPSVELADRTAEILNRHEPGCAEYIHGGTPIEIRREILARYARGQFQFLCNCAIATEGFDDPGIQVVVPKPTKSRLLYCQMVGRGTRPLPGTVDGFASAEERKASVAASDKTGVEILDFCGNSGKHKLITTADILGGNYSEEVVERAKKKAAKAGKPIDMTEALAEAEEENEEALRQKRKHVIATAKWGSKEVDPFNVLEISHPREPGWHKGRKPSDKMVAALERMGIKNPDRMSFVEAKRLLGESAERRVKGLCSFKQAKVLAKYGEPTNLTFDQARATIDKIAANGWRPLV